MTLTRRCKSCWDPSGWSWSLTQQAASQISLPPTPHSLLIPHTATTHHVLNLRALHIAQSVGNTQQIYLRPQHRPSSYRLLSDAIGCYRLLSDATFLVRAYRHTSASRLCFAQISRALLYLITSSMMTWSSWQLLHAHISYSALPLTADKRSMWREMLPLVSAEGPPGVALLKIIYVLQRISTVAPLRQRMSAGCLQRFWTRKRSTKKGT